MSRNLNTDMTLLTVGDLTDLRDEAAVRAYIADCESRIAKEIDKLVAEFTVRHGALRLLFVSGPSSSGKTSIAALIDKSLQLHGKKAISISIDDYYVPGFEYELLNGLPNFEMLSSIDLPLLANDIKQLLQGKAVHLPLFSFIARDRTFAATATRIDADTVIVVEGLHALAQPLLSLFSKKMYRALFVMPRATLQLADDMCITADEIRQLRRMGRDFRHRGSLPLATLDYWPVLAQSETEVIKKYLSNADYFINTCLPYEFALYRTACAEVLARDLAQFEQGDYPRSNYLRDGDSDKILADAQQAVEQGRNLLKKLNYLPAWPLTCVPPTSLLNEFIK